MKPMVLIRNCLSKLWHLRAIQFFVPQKLYCMLEYRHYIGKKLNLKNPITFNEKIQWLKIYDHNPIYTRLVDKYAVRLFVKEKIGGKYLIPLLGVYENIDEIPFDKLPEQYVLKCTHDSGTVIVKNHACIMTVNEIKKKLEKALKRNYYYVHREWPYKNVKPRIICEQYLEAPANGELIDYKFMCFNGRPKCLFLCLDRHNGKGLKVDIYDMEWTPMPFERRHYPRSGRFTPKPKCFDEMVEVAKKLSEGLPFVRVDLYENNGKVYFGELTLYPGSGLEEFTPESYDRLLGDWIELPNYH